MEPVRKGFGRHGVVRGLEHVPVSPQFEGRFGRMFRHLRPAEYEEEELMKLGDAMTAPADKPDPEDSKPGDDEENLGIHAGYTYFGQFIDHDLTFDPSTLAQQKSDPEAIVDFRTPRFDLDNLYGRGPDDQPYLYDFQSDGSIKMLLGRPLTGNDGDTDTRDLPRTAATGRRFALIGDKRNDENVIVSQLQGIMLRFHNRMVNYHKANKLPIDFAHIRQAVQFHYQWVVIHDFLPTIIGSTMLQNILPHLLSDNKSILDHKPNLKFYKPRKDPFMPVEFSAAAYRFGHSMVRPIYRLNSHTGENAPEGKDPRLPIFPGLQAFGEFDPTFAIDWSLFFDFGNNPDQFSKQRIQPAYKIDTSLVNPLRDLPAPITGEKPPSLPQLNLRRGNKLRLPSGQAVARAMGLKPLTDDQLLVGKATETNMKPGTQDSNQSITKISESFADNAPLWFYILAEPLQQFKDNNSPLHLGPVGGRIVGEVFVGIMHGDPTSIFGHPNWRPYKDFLNPKGQFNIADLIKQAMRSEK